MPSPRRISVPVQIVVALTPLPTMAVKRIKNFVLWNCNGLHSRKLEFDTFLEKEHIDVALVTETHTTDNYSWRSSQNDIVLHAFHPSGKAQGGSAIYVKKMVLVYSCSLLRLAKDTALLHSLAVENSTSHCCLTLLLSIFTYHLRRL